MKVLNFKATSNEPRSVRILHISDLHLTNSTSTDQGCFLHFKNSLNSAIASFTSAKPSGELSKPFDLIFVTGDVADNSELYLKDDDHREVLQKGKAYLNSIATDYCINGSSGLVVIPGNHDYRWFGNVSSKNAESAFKEIFAENFATKIFEFEQMKILAACFDSNFQHATRPFEFARGHVDPDILSKLTTSLAQINSDPRMIKIALIHHHPLPVAQSELESDDSPSGWVGIVPPSLRRKLIKTPKIEGAPEYMLLRNSGSVLHRLLENNFRMVLHGHLHEHGYWRTFARTYKNEDKWLEVISGASVGRPDQSNNYNFNIITVFNDGYIDGFRHGWKRDGNLVPPVKIPSTPYEIISEHENAVIHSGSTVPADYIGQAILYKSDRYIQKWNVDLATGDLESFDSLEGVRGIGHPRDEITVQNYGDALTLLKFDATVSRALSVEVLPPKVQSTLKGASIIVCKLKFSPPLAQHPVDLSLYSRVRGVMFTSIKDKQMFRGTSNKLDEVGYTVLNPTEQLFIKLQFTNKHRNRSQQWIPKLLQCRVLDPEESECARETERVFFYYWPDEANMSCEAVLNIKKPRLFYTYLVQWELPEIPVLAQTTMRRTAFGRNLTENANGRQSGDQFAADLLTTINDGCKKYFSTHNVNDFRGYVYGFNETDKTLECVATTGTQNDALARAKISYGRDVIGTAYRRCEIVHFSKEQAGFELFKNVPADISCIIAFPLLDKQSYDAIGVFVVASSSPATALKLLIEHKNHLPVFETEITKIWEHHAEYICR